ncbi:MAG: acyltransferase [Candidatus Manganitrophus sp. SB1]|nr:acyltransferase [Candidatus Manganitrophus morganii]
MMSRSAPVHPNGASAAMRLNNFDLIRLFAALQVLIGHGSTHLEAAVPGFVGAILAYFPGVPIFFIISGFLISMSWDRAPSLKQYVWNRALRIYPALWVCLFFSIGIFLASGVKPDSLPSFFGWFFAQITLFQFYNPDFLRGFGIGVINGSLWTIPVELQFYILLPLLAIAAKRTRLIWVVHTLIAAALMILAMPYLAERHTTIQKLFGVSIIPYLFLFLIGVLTRQLYEKYPNLFKGKGLIWSGVYGLWVAIEIIFDIDGGSGNRLNVVSIILLGMLTVSFAFSKSELSSYILKNNDISYGVYIYHVPVINFLMFNQIIGLLGFVAMLFVTIVIAMLSWRFIEKPALGLKNYSLLQRGGV